METVYLILGIGLIVIGFLVVPFPMLLAGYNTIPKEERQKIDMDGFSRVIRLCFCIMGIIIMAGSYLLRYFELADWVIRWVLFVLILGTIIIKLNEKRFITAPIQKTRNAKLGIILGIVITIGAIGAVIYTAYPAEITVNEKELVISGAYGVTLPRETITGVELRDQLPKINTRSNGTSIGKYHKGNFYLEELGASKLYLNASRGPYLIILSQGGWPLIINRDTPEEVQVLYEKLKVK